MEEANEECTVELDMDIPENLRDAAKRATLDLLPSKSRQQYDIAYKKFTDWCKVNKIFGNLNENVFLAYFEEKSHIWKSPSLWSHFSMLKSSVSVHQNKDISKYFKVIAFLKRKSEGYRPKKSKVLSIKEVDLFLEKASNEKYLLIKVATIIGLFGACRRDELCRMTMDDVKVLDDMLHIQIPDTKNKKPRTFTVVGKKYMNFFSEYISLRPSNISSRRLFVQYINGKCTSSHVGINTFGQMPRRVAEFLNLPDPHLYTGHCYRRSAATALADSGANLTLIKQHGGWKSSNVAEGYIESSIENKKKIASMILPSSGSSSSDSHILNLDTPVVESVEACSSSSHVTGLRSSLVGTETFSGLSLTNITSDLHSTVVATNEKTSDSSITINVNNCTNCNVYLYPTLKK